MTLLDIVGCTNISRDMAKKIETKLHEKYQKEFVVKALGKRYGTGRNNTVTAYCNPKDNEQILFAAVLDREGILLQDTYLSRSICVKLEEQIQKAFEEQNRKAYARIYIAGHVNEWQDKTIEEIIEENPKIHFITNTIVNQDSQEPDYETIYQTILNRYPNIILTASNYQLADREFETCEKKMKQKPMVSETLFKQLKPVSSKTIQMKDGTISQVK